MSHVSVAAALGPGEGIVLVAGGAVHNDTDIDGVLDAGESIDYHYTVLNLGDLDLSALALTDVSGAVSCPQPTLAVGASMVCTRNYVISAADQTAGIVVNQVDVDGMDSLARDVAASDVLVSLNLAGRAGIRVFKSPRIIDDADGNSVTSVGDLIEYTFVIKNSGAEQLTAVNLTEPDPGRIDTPITCAAQTLGGQAFSGNGSGTLISNDVLLCTAQYTVRMSDADIRQVLNVAEVEGTAPIAGSVIGTAASTVVVPVPPIIGVSKAVISNSGAGLGTYAVHYMMVVSNLGVVALEDVQVEENLRLTFPLPVTFEVFDVQVSGTGAPNSGFDGELDTGLLDASVSTLAPGDSMIIDLFIGVRPGYDPGPFLNQVVATGHDSINQAVSDLSVSGTNPDPDGDGNPDEDEPTPIIFGVPVRLANVPAMSPLGLLGLLLAVASVGWMALRRT
ncbi:MAG: hypothetical protein KDJ14_13665 [Xanthomonadales bacterium]|nr:hypothetical protein [Xanthomonadales bacterium]